VTVNAFATNDSNRENCRLELEREPTTSYYEDRRKKVEGITKTTLFFRRGTATEVERPPHLIMRIEERQSKGLRRRHYSSEGVLPLKLKDNHTKATVK
jgi:hypothetical protein